MFNWFKPRKPKTKTYAPEAVGQYYNEWTERYMEVADDYIQAARTSDMSELMQHIVNTCDIQDGHTVLDAGCGIGGPALFIAQAKQAQVEGISISDKQIEIANQKKADAQVQNLQFKVGDYHKLDQFYPAEHFNRAVFIESLGHSNDTASLFKALFKVMQKGGLVYIKDFYQRLGRNPEEQAVLDKINARVNHFYSYNTLELSKTIADARSAGFDIVFVRKPAYTEDWSTRIEFERRFGIDIFEGKPVFGPADWLEILLEKPSWNYFDQA
jgi:cyclopropane fatty-acyl-phospholipid synthase-like methyltransferase